MDWWMGLMALGLGPPWPRALQPSEVRFFGRPTVPAGDFGQCLCSQDIGDRHVGPGVATVQEAQKLMQDLRRPGLLRRRALQRISPVTSAHRLWPRQLLRQLPARCYHAHVDAGSCTGASLSASLLAAQAAPNPAARLARLDDALLAALVMRDCPQRLLADFACGTCVGPPKDFRLGTLLATVRKAHQAFLSGARADLPALPDAKEISCEPARVDAAYEEAAADVSARPARVACLYLAALPNDYKTLRRVAGTFGRHCDWTKFFAARREEKRKSWRLRVRGSWFEIVNLARIFPEAQADESWMRTQWEAETGVKDVFRTRLWSGNTIQKSLLMAVHTARNHLDDADIFCWLELDSAFIAENLRAFARVQNLRAEEPYFVAALHLGMKLQVGIFPHTAGGVCVTKAGLARLARHLERLDMDAVKYPFPKRVGFWAPVLKAPEASKELAARVHGCGFVAGHWWDIMLGRCFVAANVSAHPKVEDTLGRYYFATEPLPCQEHLRGRQLPPLPGPRFSDRLRRLGAAVCETYGFAPELHRFAVCEPEEVMPVADYWISPFAIGFHGYKNLSQLLHAYRILYGSETCTWALSYRPKVLPAPSVLAQARFLHVAGGMPRPGRARGAPVASALEDPDDFFVPTASTWGAVKSDPFEKRISDSSLGGGVVRDTKSAHPLLGGRADSKESEIPDEPGPGIGERGPRRPPGHTPPSSASATPPLGPPPAERGPRERLLQEDARRSSPEPEFRPLKSCLKTGQSRQEESPRPKKSCLKQASQADSDEVSPFEASLNSTFGNFQARPAEPAESPWEAEPVQPMQPVQPVAHLQAPAHEPSFGNNAQAQPVQAMQPVQPVQPAPPVAREAPAYEPSFGNTAQAQPALAPHLREQPREAQPVQPMQPLQPVQAAQPAPAPHLQEHQPTTAREAPAYEPSFGNTAQAPAYEPSFGNTAQAQPVQPMQPLQPVHLCKRRSRCSQRRHHTWSNSSPQRGRQLPTNPRLATELRHSRHNRRSRCNRRSWCSQHRHRTCKTSSLMQRGRQLPTNPRLATQLR
ncbi:unnamed protein product, partial [Effrenium voratum]